MAVCIFIQVCQFSKENIFLYFYPSPTYYEKMTLLTTLPTCLENLFTLSNYTYIFPQPSNMLQYIQLIQAYICLRM